MKNENLLHVKLEYEESIQSKKDIISSEINLLRVIEAIKKYNILRKKELELKPKLYEKIRAITTNIKNLEKSLPKLKKAQPVTKKEKEKKIFHDKNLEAQLQELQEKLRLIGG